MNPQYKKGVLELCVLSLLKKRNCYGYEISEYLSEHIDIADGTVYPILRKLKADGLLDAGMAPGVDRMIMLLRNEENIREVIAFPMNSSAQDLMCGAPGEITEKQLREAHIKVRD